MKSLKIFFGEPSEALLKDANQFVRVRMEDCSAEGNSGKPRTRTDREGIET